MQVEFILQGKGGVGKSLIASLLAQHYTARGPAPLCIDTDPVNATFSGYPAFAAASLPIMEGDDINPRAFDQLVERIMNAGNGEHPVMVVDNGASTFVPGRASTTPAPSWCASTGWRCRWTIHC